MIAAKRNLAFGLFIKGCSHRKIVTQLGVSKSSVGRWSRKDQWVQKRNENRIAVIAEIRKKGQHCIASGIAKQAQQIEGLLRDALAELQAYQQGLLSQRQLKFNAKDIADLSKALSCLPIQYQDSIR